MEHEDRLKAMLDAYVACALWSSTENFDATDFAPEALESMRRDCDAFLKASDIPLLDACADTRETWERIGHDFWLTRNRHGAGFWDRPEVYGTQLARLLTQASHTYGSCDLYPGDDFKIHVG